MKAVFYLLVFAWKLFYLGHERSINFQSFFNFQLIYLGWPFIQRNYKSSLKPTIKIFMLEKLMNSNLNEKEIVKEN